MFEKFEFISDEDEPKEYKVLILGEAGVGKTAFINALKENVAIKKSSFSESVYVPTFSFALPVVVAPENFPPPTPSGTADITRKREFTEIIPETDAGLMIFDSVVENTINKKYNKEVANFMIRPHFHKEEQFFLMERKQMGQCNNLCKREIGKIEITEITEIPPTSRSDFHHQFDKIIIMGDYHDITTLRSIQFWAELVKAPARKIIACVNKCDISPNDPANDLQSRKANILRHYFDNYNLEFISVKTGANLLFLYKYL